MSSEYFLYFGSMAKIYINCQNSSELNTTLTSQKVDIFDYAGLLSSVTFTDLGQVRICVNNSM